MIPILFKHLVNRYFLFYFNLEKLRGNNNIENTFKKTDQNKITSIQRTNQTGNTMNIKRKTME